MYLSDWRSLSRLEQGAKRAVQGLTCDNNWLRNDSTVAVLIVSDEDNCSLTGGSFGCKEEERDGRELFEKLSEIRSRVRMQRYMEFSFKSQIEGAPVMLLVFQWWAIPILS